MGAKFLFCRTVVTCTHLSKGKLPNEWDTIRLFSRLMGVIKCFLKSTGAIEPIDFL